MFAVDEVVQDRTGVGAVRSALEGVRSALAEFSPEQAGLPDAELEEIFSELTSTAKAIEAKRLGVLARIDRRRPWAADGYLSTSSWVSHRLGETGSVASAVVKTARALEQMPMTREALASNEVSWSAVGLLVRAHDSAPEAFGESEQLLVEAAKTMSSRDLHRVVAYWREAADAEGVRRDADHAWNARRLHVSPTGFGMVRIDGDADNESAEVILAALGAEMDHDVRSGDPSDHRTPAQRRLDALVGICRSFLDRSDRPSVGGERPHVSVIVDLLTLQGATPTRDGLGDLDLSGPELLEWARPEATYTGRISIETARRLACDAGVSRIVMAGRSEPIDVGRTTPVVPAAIRRAVVARDRHCRFPGCDRLPAWCDAHHVLHWADGGRTAAANLVLLCRRHHRMVHEGRFGLRMVKGRPVFTRPDGTVMEDRAPP